MRPRLTITLLAFVALLGCGEQGEPRSTSGGDGYVADARTDPERMQVVPDAVRPGAAVEAIFPRGFTRGPGFELERAAGEDWELHYAIHSDPDAPDLVNTWTAEESVAGNGGWESGPAFSGTDPHLIPVPDDAEPGRWRVCTVPDTPGLCAEFDITSDAP